MGNKVSESIWLDGNIIIPMADVQHIEKQYHDYNSANRKIKKGDLSGIIIITKHTKWDMIADVWANNIWLSNIDKKAEKFISDWCYYRYEIEGGSSAFLKPRG